MSLRSFPRFAPTSYHWGPSFARQNDFAPLLSFMDDLTNGEVSRRQSNSKQNQERFFAPRFDLKEAKDHYVLEGELPGIEQKDISIEFSDEHSLVVSGHSETTRESGTRPKALEQGASQSKGAIKDAATSHRATVEDEDADNKGDEASGSQQVVRQEDQESEPEHTYWVSERTSGSFTRSFSFPQRVNQDAVKASLKNGILNIVVPKAGAPATRKIDIE